MGRGRAHAQNPSPGPSPTQRGELSSEQGRESGGRR
jgi:hypothetical protein